MIDYLTQLIDGYIYHLLAFGIVVYLVAVYWIYQKGGMPDFNDVYQVDEKDIAELDELGFFVSESDDGYFMSFKYGSC